MPTTLPTNAVEKSTYIVEAVFTDEDGNSVSPNVILWSLTDEFGSVINNRSLGTIDPPLGTVEVLLSGDDLAVPDEQHLERLLTLQCTYDSDAGNGLPLNDYARFEIDPIRVVT